MGENMKSDIYSQETLLNFCALRDFFASATQSDIETVFQKYISEGVSLENELFSLKGCDFREIEYDFNRLFVGPDKVVAPLFSSVYLEPNALLMGEYTVRMRKLMEELDLAVPTLINGGSIPEDFLSYELEILIILNNLMAQSQKNLELFHALEEERAWLERHLKAWIPLFIKKCEASEEKVAVQGAIKSILRLLKEQVELLP